MARRIRSVKPEILDDEKTAGLSNAAFRLFIGMITLADDHGNLRGDTRWLDAQVWWLAASRGEPPQAAAALSDLCAAGLVELYTVGTQRYAHLNGWEKHQRITNAGKPQVPRPSEGSPAEIGDLHDLAATRGDSRRTAANLGDSPLDGIGGEGKGEDQLGKPNVLVLAVQPVEPEPAVSEPVRLLAEKACAEINRLTGSSFKPDSDATVKLCRALHKARHTTDEVAQVVTDKVREWSGNPEMRRRLVPGTLLALTNFEKYLDELRSRPAQSSGQHQRTAPWTIPGIRSIPKL